MNIQSKQKSKKIITSAIIFALGLSVSWIVGFFEPSFVSIYAIFFLFVFLIIFDLEFAKPSFLNFLLIAVLAFIYLFIFVIYTSRIGNFFIEFPNDRVQAGYTAVLIIASGVAFGVHVIFSVILSLIRRTKK